MVFGATGYTGRFLVRGLRDRGVPTVAHIREGSSTLGASREHFEGLGAQVAVVPWEREAMESLVMEVQPAWVFLVLGTTKSRMRQSNAGESYASVDYGLSRMVHRAVEGLSGPVRIIYLSAMGANIDSRLPYLAARGRLEADLRAGTSEWMIVRPGLISGPDREEVRVGERVAARVSDGLLAVAGVLGARRFRRRFRSMGGEELAERMLVWALAPEGAGRVLDPGALQQDPL